jgi:Skp family chaperone for outer membrane proteins
MSRRFNKPALIAGAVGLVLVAFFVSSTMNAQEDASEIIVGTYDPQKVAEAVGYQQRVMQRMEGLQERMQQAQQAGDQQAMQEIQTEAQQIQQDTAMELVGEIEATMPQVAAATGATIIATDVAYTAPGVATEDVTAAVIAAMGGEAPAAAADEGAS